MQKSCATYFFTTDHIFNVPATDVDNKSGEGDIIYIIYLQETCLWTIVHSEEVYCFLHEEQTWKDNPLKTR